MITYTPEVLTEPTNPLSLQEYMDIVAVHNTETVDELCATGEVIPSQMDKLMTDDARITPENYGQRIEARVTFDTPEEMANVGAVAAIVNRPSLASLMQEKRAAFSAAIQRGDAQGIDSARRVVGEMALQTLSAVIDVPSTILPAPDKGKAVPEIVVTAPDLVSAKQAFSLRQAMVGDRELGEALPLTSKINVRFVETSPSKKYIRKTLGKLGATFTGLAHHRVNVA